eukprot:scaffold1009_cov188-Alexandrium_tamarense.AAC.21
MQRNDEWPKTVPKHALKLRTVANKGKFLATLATRDGLSGELPRLTNQTCLCSPVGVIVNSNIIIIAQQNPQC